MAKKNLSALMSGIMGGEKEERTPAAAQAAPEVTEEMRESLAEKRNQKRGRPRKEGEKAAADIRATFIVNSDTLRKLKYVTLIEGKLQKDVLDEALNAYLEAWQQENGRINLPKKK